MKVYCVNEEHLCDDDYYRAGARTVAIYESEQSALAAVEKYNEECKRAFEKQEDESTLTIEGKEYRRMDLEYVDRETYRYAPKTEYDYTDLWERFPQQYVWTVTVQGTVTQQAQA